MTTTTRKFRGVPEAVVEGGKPLGLPLAFLKHLI